MSPPSRMATARPMADFPSTRNIGCGGSTAARRTSAMSPRRSSLPPAVKLTARMSASERKAPETRSVTASVSVRSTPAGRTTFCASSAATSVAGSSPSPARVSGWNSTRICSSWAPRISILETSGISSSSERMSSTLSRTSRSEKPSATKP